MQDQPPLDLSKDVLFLLTGQWDDADGGPWLCADCCTMEGACGGSVCWADDKGGLRPLVLAATVLDGAASYAYIFGQALPPRQPG